jgi:hypothetical protein
MQKDSTFFLCKLQMKLTAIIANKQPEEVRGNKQTIIHPSLLAISGTVGCASASLVSNSVTLITASLTDQAAKRHNNPH